MDLLEVIPYLSIGGDRNIVMLNCAIVVKPIIARVHRHLLRPAIKNPVRHLHRSIAPKLVASTLVCTVVGGSVPGWLPVGPISSAGEAAPAISNAPALATAGAAPVEAFFPGGGSGNGLLSGPLSGLFVSAQESAGTTRPEMLLHELEITSVPELAPVDILEQTGIPAPSAVPEPQSILIYLLGLLIVVLFGRKVDTAARHVDSRNFLSKGSTA